jgi:hypothetical protein
MAGSHASISLPHAVITRAPGLLPMMYRTTELAEELKVPVKLVKQLVDRGAPHERDSRQHIWFNGTTFSQWVEEVRTSQAGRTKLGEDEAWCMPCGKAVKLTSPTATVNNKQQLLSGTCPECGCTINRGARA